MTKIESGLSSPFKDSFDQVASEAYAKFFLNVASEDMIDPSKEKMVIQPPTLRQSHELVSIYLPDITSIAHTASYLPKVIAIMGVHILAQKVGIEPHLVSGAATFLVLGYPLFKSIAINLLSRRG